ncbi:hypothetical protein ACS0TY_013698 [Phlomoides rotata]
MMKEKTPISISRSRQICMLTCATEDEKFVAQILLDLPILTSMAESGSPLKWGCRRRRSRFNDSSFRKNDVKIEERRLQSKAAEERGGAASSPVTPLAFSPSESDRKSRHHHLKRRSRKRSKEKYTAMIEELTQRRDLLREEIGNVTNYYDNLIAYNSELKAMKEEVLNSDQIKEEPKLEISRYGNVGVELRQGKPSQPLVSDQKIHLSVGPPQFDNGLEPVGPFGIPDLNISAAEESNSILSYHYQTDRRARFAEARRRRMDIIKIKIMRGATSSSGMKFHRAR